MKEKLKNLIERIELSLSVNDKIAVGLTLAVLSVLGLWKLNSLSFTNEYQNTVMITTLARNSGGTGVVINSSEWASEVLTNNHVCEAIKAGGVVSSEDESYNVLSFRQSQEHDLCLVTVRGNLHARTKVAKTGPNQLDDALVSGHPHLLPTVQTRGHYSGNLVIPILSGLAPCEAGENNPYCAMFGVKPVVRLMESTIVTATIMPGSSGSGVYNANHELTNLVFAGNSGDGLSYAFVVPYEYLKNFLDHEVKSLEAQSPSYRISLGEEASESKHSYDQQLVHVREVCKSLTTPDEVSRQICKAANNSTLEVTK